MFQQESPFEPRYLPFASAKKEIAEGDLLLFRAYGPISIAGRGVHTHAAKASWWDEELFVLEIRQWHGGRAVALEQLLSRYRRRIDVFQVNPRNRWQEYDRRGASRFMRRLCGCSYGWFHLLAASCRHLPVVRWALRMPREENFPRRPPFCSEACALAERIGGGVDPVPHLVDRLTEPADLARSPFYLYRFTLD